jgi:hypothetical protein
MLFGSRNIERVLAARARPLMQAIIAFVALLEE